MTRRLTLVEEPEFRSLITTPRGDTIIRRTNPELTRGGHFRCCVCRHRIWPTEDEARTCAEGHHERRTGA